MNDFLSSESVAPGHGDVRDIVYPGAEQGHPGGDRHINGKRKPCRESFVQCRGLFEVGFSKRDYKAKMIKIRILPVGWVNIHINSRSRFIP